MTIEETLVSFLTSNPSISAISGDRVYPFRPAKDATLPAITYQRIETNRVRSHSGLSGLASPAFLIKSWATTLAAARALANTIRSEIDHTNIGLNSKPVVENDLDIDDPDTGIFQSILTVKIWHTE